MALDVLLRTPASLDEAFEALAERGNWTARRSLFRRRCRQLFYDNGSTGVVFTLDRALVATGLHVRLNVARPDFYGRESVEELAWLSGVLDADVALLEDNLPASGFLDVAALLDAWRGLNDQAWDVVTEAGAEFAVLDRTVADTWWVWQHGLEDRRARMESIAWLPKVTLLRDASTGRAVRASTWAEGQAEALPPTDLVLYLASVRRPSPLVAIPSEVVRSTLADLLVDGVSDDGVAVSYTPTKWDEEVRQRAARLADDYAELAWDGYRPVAGWQLHDR